MSVGRTWTKLITFYEEIPLHRKSKSALFVVFYGAVINGQRELARALDKMLFL